MKSTKWDNEIKAAVFAYFPDLLDVLGQNGWLLIKAQIWQESMFDPKAVSPAGAVGLMQIMPATAKELHLADRLDPVRNINAGVRYLAQQWDHLTEIPHETDRLSASLASYNAGRGYINEAMAQGRDVEGQPKHYSSWKAIGSPRGCWQTWPVIARILESVTHRGKKPDHSQAVTYVSAIWHFFSILVDTQERQ